ncbi:hypothetical protein M8818_000012 [Zalaria obscura]|uniref:Uncharacterized protein n=1 Tax=Zalaria obscura TaxID=2024903 RepID=A0ACC3SNV4_9PEZI
MLQGLARVWRTAGISQNRASTIGIRSASYATRANTGTGEDEEIAAARRWLADLNPDTIPRNICDVSFSRSSGPGGQNVNKVNSKATLKLPLSSFLPLVPALFRPYIHRSRYCASDSLVIQADDSRKQNDNVQRCFQKLHQLLVEIGKETVPGETTVEQQERVKKLQKAENEGRLKMKKKHSDKKSARRGGGKADY